MAKVKEPEARAAYLAMGPDRSLRRLRAELAQAWGDGAPHQKTLDGWSKRYDWQRLAADHDERAAAKVIAKVEARQVREQVNVLQRIESIIDVCTEATTLESAAKLAAANGDLRALTASAVDAAKLRELLLGNATTRAEVITDDRSRSVEDALELLSARLRTSGSKAPTVADTGTA